MDIVTYALSKKYTQKSLDGLGALKGANCVISKIEETDDGSIVTYQWTGTSGAIETRTMTVKNGVGIQSIVRDNANNKVIYTMTDGTQHTVNDIEVEAVDVSYTNADEADIDNVKEALDLLFEEGGGVLESPITANVQIGQVTNVKTYPVGTPLETILREILTEQLPPSVNVVISPSKTLYNIVTESIPSLTINCTVTKKSNDVSKIEYFINDTLVHTVTSGVANGGTFPYVYNTEIKETTTVKVVVTDVKGLKTTQSKTLTFVGMSYYGYIEPNVEVSEAVIKTLQHNVLQNTKALTYSGITCTYHRIVYCYDKAFGELSTIIDPINNFSYNNSFEKKIITVDGIEKLCYILIQPTGADDVTVKFS